MHTPFYLDLFKCKLTEKVDQVTRLIGVRHGQTTWNEQRILQGQEDTQLTAKGHMQAELVADYLGSKKRDATETISALYSSDLQRARDTAHAISTKLNLPVLTTPLLRERHAGIGQGMSFEDYDRVYKPVEEDLDVRFPLLHERGKYTELPQAETFNMVAERAYKALSEIIVAHPGQTIVFVTHARVLSTLVRSLQGELVQPLDNCCTVDIMYDPSHKNLLTVKAIRNLEDKPGCFNHGF